MTTIAEINLSDEEPFPIELTVLTPATRPENWPLLRDNLAAHDVLWVPILTADPVKGVDLSGLEYRDWMQPLTWAPGDGDACYEKLNYAMQQLAYQNDPEMWYLTLADDSLYPAGFFETVRAALSTPEAQNAAVAIVSARRGHNTPTPGGHSTTDLPADPRNMRFGCITLEQIILRGQAIIDGFRWDEHNSCTDGTSAEALLAQYGPTGQIVYINPAYVLFNALEPGRWNSLPPLA